MALKRQYNMMELFSMASMTDVIFLLLIFFMVTSTFVFPTALEINLPESSEQTALKPTTTVYIDSARVVYAAIDGHDPQPMQFCQLEAFLQMNAANPTDSVATTQDVIAVYADSVVPYGEFVKVLNVGSKLGLKMVLATKAAPASAMPSPTQP